MGIDMSSPVVIEYAAKHGVRFIDRLGFGNDGTVFASDQLTACKFFVGRPLFDRELEVYHRLLELGITTIAGHAVPMLKSFDTDLQAIEMSIVRPPFLVDFAGAKRPDEVPDFEPYVWEEHAERMKELFEEHWHDALAVASDFAQLTGFVLLDIHPGNIRFSQ